MKIPATRKGILINFKERMMADLYEYSTPEIVRLMGTRFKDYRMRCGLTQKDVAEQSGIELTTIHKFESGAAVNLLSELPEFPLSIRLCFTRN